MKFVSTAFLIATACWATGCGQKKATLSAWQKAMEQSSVARSNGDMSFLRQTSHVSEAEQFAVLGGKSPDESTDVAGILLARREINNADWLVFLVAVVEKCEVSDIRVAMMSDEPDRRTWLISRENSAAVDSYKRYHQSVVRRNHSDREEPPNNPALFPSESDVFRLDVAGNTVTAVEEKSGVKWTLVLPDKKTARHARAE